MAPKRKSYDFWLLLTVIALITMGIIMVFSASAPYASFNFGDSFYFLKSQLKAAGLGLVAMLIMMNFNYKKLEKLTPWLLLGSFALLIAVLIPGLGTETNGARRWLFGFQPSEIAKLAIILFFAYSLSKRRDQLKYFSRGLLPYLFIIGIYAVLLMLEPHLSGLIIIASTGIIILFVAGARLKHFALLAVPAILGLVVAVLAEPYRVSRVLSFMDPWKYPQTIGLQAINSLYAIGSGGIFGRGLGKSLQKYLYIPEPHTDFIFSVFAEEFGLIGSVVVLGLFMFLIWRGFKIAMNVSDTFGKLTAIGITSLIAIQVIINIAVVTSSMPVTGMPLPFFTNGGTSLLFLMASVGILLNISRYANYERI